MVSKIMKIKSIDTFSLSECQEYLSTNSNGGDTQEVIDRMEHLRKLEERKLRQNAARKTDEFNTEFNRYYGTQRYPEAFAICLLYLNEVDNNAKVIEKANSVIPKLRNRIQIPSSISISYDWLIDQLVLKGYGKMKYDGRSLKWKMSVVQIFSKGKSTEIISKYRVNPVILTVINILLLGAFWTLMTKVLFYNFSDELPYWLVVISSFFTLILVVTKKIHRHRHLLREIANIIIKHLSK